ncbi:MAG: IS4 family transposase [Blastocatellia bacterium]
MIKHLQQELFSTTTRELFRQRPQDFTRIRALTFARVALLILRGHKLSLQNALNKFFTALGEVFKVPSSSAYSHARLKLKPELFAHLNSISCSDFYQLYHSDSAVKLWHGHRLLAADGTYLNLPDTAETRAEYTLQVNQHEGGECVQALCCLLYDLRNDLGLVGVLSPRQGESKQLLEKLWPDTKEGDVLVLDRAYADYCVFAYAIKQKREVLVRLPRGRFKACEGFWQSESQEEEILLQAPRSARAFVEKHELAKQIRVRLVRVELDGGETEVLATTMIDKEKYPAWEMKQVYGWRWREETFFDRFKNIFEVERFSGTSVQAIKQDFQGTMFLATLESILIKSAQEEMDEESKKRERKGVAKVNRAVSYVAMVDRVVELLMWKREVEEVLEELHHLFQTNPTRIREGRREERPKLKYAHKLRFHKYIKKLNA